MSTYRDYGIVLRTRTVRDADRQFVVFTRDHGKLQLLAKGSRKGRSKMAGHLTAPGEVDLMVATGRLIDHLAGVALVAPAPSIMDSLPKTALLQGLLLTVDAFTRRGQPEVRLYDLLRELLAAVEALPEPTMTDRVMLMAAFSLKMTEILGFGLELGRCVRCRRQLEIAGNALNVVRGGVECRQCRDSLAPTVASESIKSLRYLRDAALVDAVRLKVPGPILREINFLNELQLAAHLETRLPALRFMQAVA